MLPELAPGTIDQGLNSNDNYPYLADAIPLKSRETTGCSTCSVVTEKKSFHESRDYSFDENLEADSFRDGPADIISIGNADASGSFSGSYPVAYPLAAENEHASDAPEDQVAVPCQDGSIINNANEYSCFPTPVNNINSIGSANESCLPTKPSSENSISRGNDGGVLHSTLDTLTRAGNNLDAAIINFYGTLEAGAERILCLSQREKEGISNDPTAYADLLSKNTSESIRNIKNQDSIKSSDQLSIITTPNPEADSIMSEVLEAGRVQPKAQAGWSIFGCSGSNQPAPSPSTFHEMISDTLDITSANLHVLDSFSDDLAVESENPDLISPKAQRLLDEIKEIESSLFEVRKSTSKEEATEIKKQQDPFIQKKSTIKQCLLDQNILLQSAPEDTKSEYYSAIAHAAIMNVEVETKRAELELMKMRLETMKLDEEMSTLMDENMTFDSSYDSVMTKESDEEHAFDRFSRYVGKKFQKTRKKRPSEKK